MLDLIKLKPEIERVCRLLPVNESESRKTVNGQAEYRSMHIGDLIAPESGVSANYVCCRRGVAETLPPDLRAGKDAGGGVFPAEGRLCGQNTFGWKWTTVLNVGIDIVINLHARCFIDRIRFSQETGSALASVEILKQEKKDWLCVGRLIGGDVHRLVEAMLTVPVGDFASRIVVRLNACFCDIAIKDLAIIGAGGEGPVPYPIPVSVGAIRRKPMRIESFKQIAVSSDASADTEFAAQLLSEKLAEDHGKAPPVVRGDKVCGRSIIIGKPDERLMLGGAPYAPLRKEGYRIETGAHAVCTAGDRRGLIYGVETIIQLLKTGALPFLLIEDYPRMAFRGVHIGLPPREEIPFVKRLIRYVLAPMRYNTLFIEFAGGMRSDRRPEISAAWEQANADAEKGLCPPVPHAKMGAGGKCLEKHEVRDLVAYARAYGMEVIPEVQSLGHVQYLTLAYPEIAEREERMGCADEIDLKKADPTPDALYPHCYCPLHEKSYEVIFDVIDEIVETVRPERFVHMGHDEVKQIGVCPRCREKAPADLFVLHATRMHNRLRQKGLGMMIWSDMLQDSYKTAPALDRIPKDIVLLDFIWYFLLDKDIEDRFLSRGFKVMMGNMYSSHYPRYETRISKPGMIGAEISTWLLPSEKNFGREGKLYDMLYSANMMWSSKYDGSARLVYDRMIGGLVPGIRNRLHERAYPSQGKEKKCMPIPFRPGQASVPAELVAALPPAGTQVLGGIPFKFQGVITVASASARVRMPVACRIAVRRKAHSIVFLHAAGRNAERIPWQPLKEIGSYTIDYEDGGSAQVPIEYGGGIGEWSRRYADPLSSEYYRHQGYIATYFADPLIQSKTPAGGDVTIYGFEWINPRPDTSIRAVTLRACGNTDAAVYLVAMTAVVASRA